MIQTGGTVDLLRSVGLHRSADLHSRVPNARHKSLPHRTTRGWKKHMMRWLDTFTIPR